MASKRTGRPTGRPAIHTPELEAELLARVSQRSLVAVCKADDMPHRATVYGWMRDVPGFHDRYAQATEERAEALFEETLEIADDPTLDWVERHGDAKVIGDHEHIHRSKLRVDTRKWYLSKLKPKKYGERSQVDVGGQDGGRLVISWAPPPEAEGGE